MIEHCYFIESSSFNPYENLSLEELLLNSCPKDALIMYLWQNQNTVVIGRNQNSWRECNVQKLQEDGGHLARRLSGGGAVYHDLGNLNFTFIAHRQNYDIKRHLGIIIEALKEFGIEAYFSGRNDILVGEHKFSGNAFYQTKGNCYHHGTILIDVDFSKLSQYLQVSKEKLASKGVASVKSRVINLNQLNPQLNTENIRPALIKAMENVLGLQAQEFILDQEVLNRLPGLTEHYSTWDWLFGADFPFDVEFSDRFDWGEVQIHLHIKNGLIKQAAVYSDAMAFQFPAILQKELIGLPYTLDSIKEACKSFQEGELEKQMIADLIGLFKNL